MADLVSRAQHGHARARTGKDRQCSQSHQNSSEINVGATLRLTLRPYLFRGDNHLSLFDGADDASIDAVIERLDASGDTLYHPFLGVENGENGPDGVS